MIFYQRRASSCICSQYFVQGDGGKPRVAVSLLQFPALSLCSSSVGTAAGEQSRVPRLGLSSRGSWSRAQLPCLGLGVPHVPDPASLELEVWENAQAEALHGERQHIASAGDTNTAADKILFLQ